MLGIDFCHCVKHQVIDLSYDSECDEVFHNVIDCRGLDDDENVDQFCQQAAHQLHEGHEEGSGNLRIAFADFRVGNDVLEEIERNANFRHDHDMQQECANDSRAVQVNRTALKIREPVTL